MADERGVAFCGILCNKCPAYIAKKTDDDELRKKTAERWSTDNFPLTGKDINCDGCVSGKEVLSFCNVCDIRVCGLKKNIENCAHCDEYPCKKLKKPWEGVPEAKVILDEIREGLIKK